MATRIPRLGEVQLSALEIYIFDDCHAEDEFPGWLDGATLMLTDKARGYELLMGAVNSADDDKDSEMRDALARIASRVGAASAWENDMNTTERRFAVNGEGCYTYQQVSDLFSGDAGLAAIELEIGYARPVSHHGKTIVVARLDDAVEPTLTTAPSSNAATSVLRRAALETYAEMGERHVYSGVTRGLAEVLLTAGLTPPAERPAWAITDRMALGYELSVKLHDPLCSIDSEVSTFEEIAQCVKDVLMRSLRTPSLWHGPRAPYSSAPLVDFAALDDEVREYFRQQKIRFGTKMAAEFYANEGPKVLEKIRGIARNAVDTRNVKNAKAAEAMLAEHLPPIGAERSSWIRYGDIMRRLMAVAGLQDAAFEEALGARLHELDRRIAEVESTARFIAGMGVVSVGDEVMMGCMGRKYLGPLVEHL